MSNVCKFYQTNSCRYGNRCRFQHVYENTRSQSGGTSILKSGNTFTKTNYYPTNSTSSPSSYQSKEDVYLKRFTEDVAITVKAIEDQGIWPLSCFGCIQSYGNLQGFEDISPEELRWKAYEARAAGNFQQYVTETQVLLNKAAAVRSVFIGKGPTASSILNAYHVNGLKKESNQSSPGTSAFSSGSGIFQNISSFSPQNKPSFETSNPVDFGMQQTSVFNTNIFAQALQDGSNNTTNSPFGSQVQSTVFGQRAMNVQEPIPMFEQNNSNMGTDFFKQNIFGNAIQSSQPVVSGGFFQSPPVTPNVSFGPSHLMEQNSSKQVSVNVLYSQVGDLTDEELDQYKATTFTYGKTPLKPPPKELC